MIARFRAAADARGLILVAPKSKRATWDIIAFAARETISGLVGEGQAVRYDRSEDGDRIDEALAAFKAPPRSLLIIAGFSDGASFAIAAGTDRRRKADAVLAFSPGVQIASTRTTRRIPVHISHGRQDEALAFDFTKGVIMPAIERAGVNATLHPFEGRHAIPDPVLNEMLDAVLPSLPAPAAARLRFTRDALGAAWTQGIADRTTGRPVTIDDPVRIASISKLVVALGVMRLVEAGKLDLDRDVSHWLGWRPRNPAFPDEPITLRLLLSHRSSLTDAVDYVLPFDRSVRDALADPKAWDAEHRPGSFFRYANLNFPLIASVMESATGERFDRLMMRLVIAPLGLDACFNWASCPDTTIARAVTLYGANGEPRRDDDHGKRPACPIVPAADGNCDLARWQPGFNGASFSPQGGLRISVRDLAKIGQILLNDGRGFLSKGSIDAMLAPAWTYDGRNGLTGEATPGTICRYGLGVQTLATRVQGCREDLFGDGTPRTGHAGEAYGLRSGLWVDRDAGTGVAYFVTAVADDAPLGAQSSFTRAEEIVARASR